MALSALATNHWRFDEATGQGAVDAVGAATLTQHNNVAGGVAGVIGTCRLTASSGPKYFSRADEAALRTNGVSFSWCGWVYNGFDVIMNKALGDGVGGLAENEYYVGKISGGDCEFWVGTAGVVGVSADMTGWHFVAAVQDWANAGAATIKLSVDGAAFATAAVTPANANARPLLFGAVDAGGGPAAVNSRFDSWSFFKGYALTQGDVATIYNGGAGRAWPFLWTRTFSLSVSGNISISL